MKQKIISFLSTCNEDIRNLCSYLYKHPESSYNEVKASNYICDLLDKYNFQIEKNFLNIKNAFIAKKRKRTSQNMLPLRI